ncbi:MFS transporter, partial [Caballeronia sp. M23-90]
IAGSLHASASQAGLTLSLFMAGFAVGPIVYGPLCDARGRKPTLLLGLALFTVGGIGSAVAPVNIAGSLHASASQAGLTLSLFMAGFAVGPIVYGPLCDARGRKPT